MSFRRNAKVSAWISPVNNEQTAPLKREIRATGKGACALIAALFISAVYSILALLAYNYYRDHDKLENNLANKIAGDRFKYFNPAVLTAEPYGNASLSNMQLLWFTLIVTGLSAYYWLLSGALVDLSQGLLTLLGITAATKLVAAGVTGTKDRLSLDNWNWLVSKGYLVEESDISPIGKAKWRHLVMNGSALDPTRYQLVLFSFLIGMNLIFGDVPTVLNKFVVPSFFVSLQGASSLLYVLGKVVSPNILEQAEKRWLNWPRKTGISLRENWSSSRPALSHCMGGTL